MFFKSFSQSLIICRCNYQSAERRATESVLSSKCLSFALLSLSIERQKQQRQQQQ